MDLISPSSKGQWYSTTFKYGTSQLDTIYLNGAVYLSIYWNVIPKVVKIHQNGGFPNQGYPRTFHFFNHPDMGVLPMETPAITGVLWSSHPAIQDKLFGPCVCVCRRRDGHVWRRGEIQNWSVEKPRKKNKRSSSCKSPELWVSGWWFGTWHFFPYIGKKSSQLTFIFFGGVGIPPTRYTMTMRATRRNLRSLRFVHTKSRATLRIPCCWPQSLLP